MPNTSKITPSILMKLRFACAPLGQHFQSNHDRNIALSFVYNPVSGSTASDISIEHLGSQQLQAFALVIEMGSGIPAACSRAPTSNANREEKNRTPLTASAAQSDVANGTN
jgi:hypothetical protein